LSSVGWEPGKNWVAANNRLFIENTTAKHTDADIRAAFNRFTLIGLLSAIKSSSF
jgi:hypothetical protein